MKKLMSLMLGLSLIVGTTALFGQEPSKDDTKKSGKKKGGKKKKSEDTTKKS
jgi:hypothetical protein